MPINSDIDTKDLIEIVKASDEEVSYDDRLVDDVKQFIIENNIKDGTDVIASSVIYEKYKDWENGKPRSNVISFFKRFGKYFKKRRVNGYSHYMVDPEPFDIPESTPMVKRTSNDGKKENKKK